MPSQPGISILNAEQAFLVHLESLHAAFPKLRIVLEHATTKDAVDMVKSLGDTVGCTITLHHLALTVDQWAGQPHNYCKPVAKFESDRQALCDAIKEGTGQYCWLIERSPAVLFGHRQCTAHS